jgi:hypothetical protein
MFLISHRGNLRGANKKLENSPSYIMNALQKGYDVEVDVWLEKNQYYLGHDRPQYKIDLSFLKNNKLWCHCKNIDVLYNLLYADVHCFFHDMDDATLTSKGYIWTYPGAFLTKKSICVMPEKIDYDDKYLTNLSGICSDYIEDYKQ